MMELVIVMLILSILAAVAAPRYSAAQIRYQTLATTKRIITDLQWAQRNAKASSATQDVVFSVENNSYTLTGMKALNRSQLEYQINLGSPNMLCTLVSADFGVSHTISFDIYGRPVRGGKIVFESGKERFTILVDESGTISTI